MNRAERRAAERAAHQQSKTAASATVDDLGLKRQEQPDPQIDELTAHVVEKYGTAGEIRTVELLFNVLAGMLATMSIPPSEILIATNKLGVALPAVVKDYLTRSAEPPASSGPA